MKEKSADSLLTYEKKLDLLAALVMSQPETLVACGLGTVKGEDLAKRLLHGKVN